MSCRVRVLTWLSCNEIDVSVSYHVPGVGAPSFAEGGCSFPDYALVAAKHRLDEGKGTFD